MTKMCCSTHTATIIAGVLTIVEGLRGLVWNFEIALLIGGQESNFSYTPPAVIIKSIEKDPYVLYAIAVVSILLNILWLIFAWLLLLGNATMKKNLMWPWLCHTQVMLLLSVFVGVMYFAQYSQIEGYRPEIKMKRSAYFRLAVGYSGWCYIWPMMMIVFSVYVVRRISDMSRELNRDSAARVFLSTSHVPSDHHRSSDPPPYSQTVTEPDESTSILQSVAIFSSPLRRNPPPPRPPPPAPNLNRIGRWSLDDLLSNDVLQSDTTSHQQQTDTITAVTTPETTIPTAVTTPETTIPTATETTVTSTEENEFNHGHQQHQGDLIEN